MEQMKDILKIPIEKESDLNFKNDKCKICNQPLYKKYNILGVDRTVRISCACEIQAYNKKRRDEEVREKQQRLEKLMTNSLMDKKFKQSTFENWDYDKGTKKMYELGKRYSGNFAKCKEKGLGLLIYGEPGNGKTYLSSCIANELLKNMVPAICVSINGLLSRVQETYNKWGKEAEGDIIRGLCNADLLIIDDLGTEKKSEWSKSMIYNIIDNRYRSNLPLIITSNLNINPSTPNGILTELYDRRTEDRILEMCTPVLNNQKSIRINQAKKKTEIFRSILYGEE
ncbi:ATP-binding protein [Clostridium algidicarnis]|uniref:ATP-binding protein n=1 Tax=Clostridium algidicarnis TaxID=37659 RepID=UPI001FD0A853|nr:ATP-binding protein [Clostridium algidicarnis]